MVDSKDIDALNAELESRLDDLFGENADQSSASSEEDLKEHYPLAELKNLILSIEWEITDEVLDNLLQQLADLQLTYKHDKIVLTFLQILNSLGNYIKTNRAKAHPKTFKILNSVFSNLDKVVLTKDMAEPVKKRILRTEMNRYKELRAQIAKSKSAAKGSAKAKPAGNDTPSKKEDTKAPTVALNESPSAADTSEKEEPILAPEATSGASEPKKEEIAPLILEESSAATVPEDQEELQLTLDEPLDAAAAADQEEPILTLDEPPEGPLVLDGEDPSPTSDDAGDALIKAAAKRRSDIQSEPQREMTATALAEAVAEIKQFIQTEIKALKVEIQSLLEKK